MCWPPAQQLSQWHAAGQIGLAQPPKRQNGLTEAAGSTDPGLGEHLWNVGEAVADLSGLLSGTHWY